jgi:transposase-like protein
MPDDQAHSAPTSVEQQLRDENPQKPESFGNIRKYSEIIDPTLNLSTAQIRAIDLALRGLSWGQIAHDIGVNPKTIWNWRNTNTQFQLALSDAIAQRRDTCDQRSHATADRATEILAHILENPDHKHQVRAAQILLIASFRLRPRPKSTDSKPEEDLWPEPVLEPKVG